MGNTKETLMNDLNHKSYDEVIEYEVDGIKVKLTKDIVQKYIVGDKEGRISEKEYKLFAEQCKAKKLNPFLKEAYLFKNGDKPAVFVVGKDVIYKRAIANPNFDGMESGIIVYDDATQEVKERKGTFKLTAEKLVGGWAKVYRKNWTIPTYVSVSFDEVAQREPDGSLKFAWEKSGATMVEKVCKVRALRETFTEDLSQMYDETEFDDESTTNTSKTKADINTETIIETVANLEKEVDIDGL